MLRPPKIFVSLCLGLSPCRYDGTIIKPVWPVSFYDQLQIIAFCPEKEAGLSTPRPPMQFIKKGEGFELLREGTSSDFIPIINEAVETILCKIPHLDGAIVKSKSPSCANLDCKTYTDKSRERQADTTGGLFTQALIKKFPNLPVIDERNLTFPKERNLFIAQILLNSQVRELDSWSKVMAFRSLYPNLLDLSPQSAERELSQDQTTKGLSIYKIYLGRLIKAGETSAGAIQLSELLNLKEEIARLEQAFTIKD